LSWGFVRIASSTVNKPKLFKGLWIMVLKKRPARTHKITTLYKPLEKDLVLEEELKDFLALISPYYFIARYPDIAMGLPGEVITKKFAVVGTLALR
jgi:HEPN domain-containing protein